MSARKTQVLSIIADFDQDERGMRPLDLKKQMNLDKSTVTYHLNQLEKDKYITSVKVGRSKFLDITDKGLELLENDEIENPVKASCGNCGDSYASFEEAKNCCTETDEEVKASK